MENAEGKMQNAEGKMQNAEGRRQKADLVKVKIKPGRGIGGYGGPGDVVEMERALAEAYVRDGYVEILAESGPSSTASASAQDDASSAADASAQDDGHAIMPPEVKRASTTLRSAQRGKGKK